MKKGLGFKTRRISLAASEFFSLLAAILFIAMLATLVASKWWGVWGQIGGIALGAFGTLLVGVALGLHWLVNRK